MTAMMDKQAEARKRLLALAGNLPDEYAANVLREIAALLAPEEPQPSPDDYPPGWVSGKTP